MEQAIRLSRRPQETHKEPLRFLPSDLSKFTSHHALSPEAGLVPTLQPSKERHDHPCLDVRGIQEGHGPLP